jgi:hypothetical protein
VDFSTVPPVEAVPPERAAVNCHTSLYERNERLAGLPYVEGRHHQFRLLERDASTSEPLPLAAAPVKRDVAPHPAKLLNRLERNPELLAHPGEPGRSDRHHSTLGCTLDPAAAQEALRQTLTQLAREMGTPLAPVEASPA